EVQCGLGRTGRLFAHEHAGITPDIMTLAKALGGGIPIGAMTTRAEIATVFTPGSHGTTFGGNPLACAAAVAAVEELARPELLEHVRRLGAHFRERLEHLAQRHCTIRQVRGLGLLLGAHPDPPPPPAPHPCLPAL